MGPSSVGDGNKMRDDVLQQTWLENILQKKKFFFAND